MGKISILIIHHTTTHTTTNICGITKNTELVVAMLP